MHRQSYAVGEITIEATCSEPQQWDQLSHLWHAVFSLRPLDASTVAPAVTLNFNAPTQPISPPEPTGEITQTGSLQGWQTQRGYFLQCGTSCLNLDLPDGRGTGRLTADFWHHSLAEQREFFLLSFLVLLRQYGYYGVHANGLVHNGAGFLLIGESGSGKTTLTMSLVRSGWQFLADDALLLYQSDGGVQAHALRRGLSCVPQTITRCTGSDALAKQSMDLMDGKRLVDIEDIRPDCFIGQTIPQVLLFPRVAGGTRSRLVPLDETHAISALMRLSTGILTDRTSVVRQLAVLRQLVEQTRSYQLLLGEDVYQQPAAVSDLLWAARGHH